MAMSFGRAGWAMIFFGLVTWGPSYLAQARGFDLRVLGASTFLIFFSGALGSLSGGFLCDALVQRGFRRGPVVKGMIMVSGLTTLAVFACLPRITAPVPAVAVLCAASFILMWGSLYWSLPSLLVDVNQVGILGAVMNCAGSIGGIAIPIITGLILQRTASFDMVLYFYSACAVVYMLGTLMINFKNA
jgi:ACS family D-galactonate transporter-like MFS transporter